MKGLYLSVKIHGYAEYTLLPAGNYRSICISVESRVAVALEAFPDSNNRRYSTSGSGNGLTNMLLSEYIRTTGLSYAYYKEILGICKRGAHPPVASACR